MSSNTSTGQIVGTIVGAVIAYFLPGSYVAIGAALGGAVGGAIDPPKGPTIVGPRLSDLSQQGASYGTAIPRVYGSIATYGNIFWIENNALKEVSNTENSGGKGGGGGATMNTYAYYATFALGLCEGPIAGIRRIWVGGKLIYDAGSDDLGTVAASNDAADNFTVYLGGEDQMPNPRMQATLGVDNTPAFRGLAYIVFEDFDLKDYGNTLIGAQIKVEVMTGADFNNYGANYETTYYNTRGEISFSARAFHITNEKIRYAAPQWGSNYPVTSSYYLYDIYADGTVVQEAEVTCAGTAVPPNQFSESGVFLVSSAQVFSSPAAFSNTSGCIYEADGLYVGLKFGENIYLSAGDPASEVSIPSVTGDYAICTDGDYIYVAGTTSTRKYDAFLNLVQTGVGVSGLSLASRLTIDKSSGRLIIAPDIVGTGTLYQYAEDLSSISVYATGIDISYAGYNTQNMHVDGDIVVYGTGGNASATPKKLYATFYHINSISSVTVPLSDIVEAEMLQANTLQAGDINVGALTDAVRGYRVAETGAIRGAIEPLQGAWPFDVVQAGYQIKAVRRGSAGSVATIEASQMGASGDGKKPDFIIRQSREMDMQLPYRVEISHMDFKREYDIGAQVAERLNTDSINIRSIDMPIVMTADEAAQKAEVLLYTYWLERHDINFTLPPSFVYLEPCDVVVLNLPTGTHEVRLVGLDYQTNGQIACNARYNSAATYTSTAVGSEILPPAVTIPRAGPLVMSLIDCPVLKDEYDVTGFIVGVASKTTGWSGANVYRSMDNGQSWAVTNGLPDRTVTGFARGAITAPASFGLIDKASALTVYLYGAGSISSVSELQMLNGANHFVYGAPGRWEIIAAMNCALQSDGNFLLTDLLRGRFGTEWAAGLHQSGDAIILLNDQTLQLLVVNASQINASYQYKPVPSGGLLEDAVAVDFAYAGVNLKPLSPVYANGSKNPSSNDWTITWQRRTRAGGELRDLVDATLSETSEAYELEIWSDNTYATLKRTITGLSSATATYTSAQQTADFGGVQTQLYVKIYQVSSKVGRGFPLAASVPYAGSTLSLVHFDNTAWLDEIGGTTSNINAQLSASYPRFGERGLYLAGNGRFVISPVRATALTDFTIEFWFRGQSTQTLFDNGGSNYWYNGQVRLNGALIISGASADMLGSATHMAITRKGSTVRAFINGALVGTGSHGSAVNLSSVTLGYYWGGPIYTSGYFDEFRLSNICLYEAAFTPPNAPFTLPSGAY